MKYFSLFSGIGGFELGIELAYVDTINGSSDRRSQTNQESLFEKRDRLLSKERQDSRATKRSAGKHDSNFQLHKQPACVGFSEIDKYAIQIYQKHFKHKNFGDITKIDERRIPNFDLLIGGFPCQSFSIAGKRQGFKDTRGNLFYDIARILKIKQPKYFLLENVKGLLSHDSGDTFKIIITTLDELGYDVQWQVLNSKNFGVPQNRERVYIVGHLRGTSRPEVFPLLGTTKTLEASTCLDANYWKGADKHGQRTLIEQGMIRRLIPLECERLQGFPDYWTEHGFEYGGKKCTADDNTICQGHYPEISDTQRYKCLGNAVTVNVVQAIIKKMFYNFKVTCL